MVPDIVRKMRGVTLLVGFPGQEPVLQVAAELALVGPVRLVCCGDALDAVMLRRIVQRHTALPDLIMARIETIRPLTAAQTADVIDALTTRCPVVLLDLLAPFLLADKEEGLQRTASRIAALGMETAVFVAVHPPPSAAQMPLLHQLQDIATRIYVYRNTQ